MQTASPFPIARILAVDDCPVQRVLISRHLEVADYLVVTVETGQEALSAARKGRFDVVVLDVNIPGMGGPEIGRALRADPATSALLIVMHSTESEAAVRERFSAFDAFVSKLPAPRQLAEQINEVIAKRRSQSMKVPDPLAERRVFG